MSAAAPDDGARVACVPCLRRSWLLGELSALLDCNCREDGRLYDLLALCDGELLKALGGRRRAELGARHRSFDGAELERKPGVAELCRHDGRFPCALQRPGVPPMLHVAGGLERLRRLTEAPVVAMLGSSRSSDYGIEMGASLARGLAASGVTLASGIGDAVATACLRSALETGGGCVAVIAGGLDVAAPARRRALFDRVRGGGCAVGELPCGVRPRRWGAAASRRTLAAIADVTVVVEATEAPRELACARLAESFGKAVAAVPGRLTSPASRGSNTLLQEGARLIRGPGDVLELLCEADRSAPVAVTPGQVELAPRLRGVLERVGDGADTAGKLTGGGAGADEVLLALSELELMGLLRRGDGGRYLPADPAQAPGVHYRCNGQMEP